MYEGTWDKFSGKAEQIEEFINGFDFADSSPLHFNLTLMFNDTTQAHTHTVLYVALTVLSVALTVIYVALIVLYVALTVLYVALTVLYVALSVLYVALTVFSVALTV